MVFNSTEFWVFFGVFYALYVGIRRVELQNGLIVVASCVFYGWWDYRFLALLFGTSAVDYLCAMRIRDTEDDAARKRFLRLSIASNLTVLGFFKYFDFFADSAVTALGALGLRATPVTLHVVLPVGVSFYTFQSIAYVVDVYRRRVEPVRSYALFALFVSYFPQLVAGPIERADRMLPQLASKRTITWEAVTSGSWLVLLGLFKKVVVADNLAPFVATVFREDATATGLETLLGVYAFALQIYGDFSGYTDIARGVSRLMGIELALNFRRPYFATNPREFWTRWHISLSEWLRDYLYVPLGGNRDGRLRTLRNLMLTMVLGGLWHGATWMFVAWGAFHGAFLVAHRALGRPLAALDRAPFVGGAYRVIAWVVTVHLVCVGWIFFRAGSVAEARHVFEMLAGSYELTDGARAILARMALYVAPLAVVDVWAELWERRAKRTSDHEFVASAWAPVRGLVYAALAFALAVAAAPRGAEFIYFQF